MTEKQASERIDRIAPVHGADRGGLGDKGWAEVPDDLIGGHPEVRMPARVGPDGALNGPQPEMDPVTGAVKASGDG